MRADNIFKSSSWYWKGSLPKVSFRRSRCFCLIEMCRDISRRVTVSGQLWLLKEMLNKKKSVQESWVKQKYIAVASGQQFLVACVLGKGIPVGREGWTSACHSCCTITSRVFTKKYLIRTAKKKGEHKYPLDGVTSVRAAKEIYPASSG